MIIREGRNGLKLEGIQLSYNTYHWRWHCMLEGILRIKVMNIAARISRTQKIRFFSWIYYIEQDLLNLITPHLPR